MAACTVARRRNSSRANTAGELSGMRHRVVEVINARAVELQTDGRERRGGGGGGYSFPKLPIKKLTKQKLAKQARVCKYQRVLSIRARACTCACMHACVSLCVGVRKATVRSVVRKCVHVHVHACTRVRTCACVRVCVLCVRLPACACGCRCCLVPTDLVA